MKTLGIDEAGRGSVIGSLTVAGIIVPQEKEIMLSRMGVKDSKRLSPQRRKILARKLKKMLDYSIVEVKAKDVDILRKTMTLNNIEEIAIQKIINQLAKYQYDRIILDSFDVKPERIQNKCRSFLEEASVVEVIAEHKADDNHLPVAAASIIAKERRDKIIDELRKEYRTIGDIGSGYPSDPKTIEFLKKCGYDRLPDTVRKSWKTVESLKNPKNSSLK